MKYIFSYDIESEVDYVEELLGDYDWMIKNGYDPNLPKGITKESTKKEIEEAVRKDFPKNKEEFISKVKTITQQLKENKKSIDEFFEAFEYEIPEEVDVWFSFYGVGGSYYVPDRMVVLGSLKAVFIFENIIHETVHLLIEKPLIEKYDISHWRKEMLVDILCESSLLDGVYRKNQIQNDSENIPMEYIEKLKFSRKDTLDCERFLIK